jgi:large subunit ribosomal protein L25
MLREATLDVEVRENAGKIANRKLRKEKKIPAIIYGGDRPAVPVAIRLDDLTRLLKEKIHENTIFFLKVAGSDSPKPALIHETQIDSISHEVLHIDFLRIDMEKPVHVQVPIELQGTPIGLKIGGLLEFLEREVEVVCLPRDIPERLQVDITNLDLHQNFKAHQLTMPEKVELNESPDMTIVRVVAPRVEAEPVAVAAPEITEPEVIGKAKKEEEEEEETEEKKS